MRRPRHRAVTVVVALLPLSYVPHEIVRTDIRFTFLTAALVVALGIRYRVTAGPLRGVEVLAVALATWAVSRLLLIAPLDGAPVDLAAAQRVIVAVGCGLVVLRIAARPELRPAVVRGLGAALAVMLAAEAYQLAVGLPALLSLGYEAPDFNYNTAEGSYRPFGTLESPVVFGIHLAMVGLAVVLAARGRAAVVAGVAGSAGLVLTQTRSAWLAVLVALAVALLLQPRAVRGTKLLVLVPVTWALSLVGLLRPDLIAAVTGRLGTITDTSDTSSSVRLDLWQGTVAAAARRPVEGYGPAEFGLAMRPFVGSLAEFGHPHDTYLQIVYLYGTVGLVLFVALLGAMLVLGAGDPGATADARRYRIAGVAAIVAYAVGSLFESTWVSFNIIVTLFLMAGLAVPVPTAAPRDPGPHRSAPGTGSAGARPPA